MLSTVLHKHIDKMDIIEIDAEDEIDQIINSIDVKELIKNPHDVMQQVADEIKNIMIDKYMSLASAQGLSLAKLVSDFQDSKKKIEIDPSKDPTENKEIVE